MVSSVRLSRNSHIFEPQKPRAVISHTAVCTPQRSVNPRPSFICSMTPISAPKYRQRRAVLKGVCVRILICITVWGTF